MPITVHTPLNIWNFIHMSLKINKLLTYLLINMLYKYAVCQQKDKYLESVSTCLSKILALKN